MLLDYVFLLPKSNPQVYADYYEKSKLRSISMGQASVRVVHVFRPRSSLEASRIELREIPKFCFK